MDIFRPERDHEHDRDVACSDEIDHGRVILSALLGPLSLGLSEVEIEKRRAPTPAYEQATLTRLAGDEIDRGRHRTGMRISPDEKTEIRIGGSHPAQRAGSDVRQRRSRPID